MQKQSLNETHAQITFRESSIRSRRLNVQPSCFRASLISLRMRIPNFLFYFSQAQTGLRLKLLKLD